MDVKQATKKAGYDIVTGATYETGGAIVGGAVHGLGGLFRRIKQLFPSLSNKGVHEQVVFV